MQLNPDCVRDVLLSIEKQSGFNTVICITRQDFPKELHKYSYDEILYHFSQCAQSGFLTGFNSYDDGNMICISDLTPKGHEFLANIRSADVWSKVKEAAKQVGVSSLKSLMSIASQVVSQVISQHFD